MEVALKVASGRTVGLAGATCASLVMKAQAERTASGSGYVCNRKSASCRLE